jgi:ATP phosphoribosyltransferase
VSDSARPLRMAVPKGSLFEGSVAILRAAGLDVGALADPGRQLIVESPDMSFVIAKPTDIPAYVAYGAVDVAISGADVLAEAWASCVSPPSTRVSPRPTSPPAECRSRS